MSLHDEPAPSPVADAAPRPAPKKHRRKITGATAALLELLITRLMELDFTMQELLSALHERDGIGFGLSHADRDAALHHERLLAVERRLSDLETWTSLPQQARQ